MIDDTTALSYWLNWRFLLCAVWVLVAMVFAALLIWRYEGSRKIRDKPSGVQQEAAGCLYDDEVWGTCSKSIHPIWLLAYRVVAFCTLLAVLLADFVINGAGKIFFYTEWTFTLVTVYFGLASSLSIIGYLRYRHDVEPESTIDNADRGSYVPPILGEGTDTALETGSLDCYCEPKFRTVASVWGYALQIIFQMSAGAVALTDSVFWLILYPSTYANYYGLSFLIVCKHSVNGVLLGDAVLNRMRFPFFRIAYLVLWTCTFVIFQWVIHACVAMRWPYPFLDLSSPYAPLWYLGIGLLVFPCYGIFILVFRLKQCYLALD
ncbi:hypothetical protein ACS0TY_010148 [Phlomoides rotata]